MEHAPQTPTQNQQPLENIILVGFMGTGKSSLVRALCSSQRLAVLTLSPWDRIAQSDVDPADAFRQLLAAAVCFPAVELGAFAKPLLVPTS